MPTYQLRLTREWTQEVAYALSQFAAIGNCNEYIIYQHEADEEVSRTHIHCYFFNWTLQIDSFRNYIKELFPTIDKSDFAVSMTAGRGKGPITLEGAIRYASKNGTIHFVRCRGYDETNITQIEETTKLIPAAPKVARKGIQLKRYDQVLSLMTLIEDRKGEISHQEHFARELFPGEIYDIIIKWAKELGQTLTEYRIIELITTIKVYQDDTESMRARILKKFENS